MFGLSGFLKHFGFGQLLLCVILDFYRNNFGQPDSDIEKSGYDSIIQNFGQNVKKLSHKFGQSGPAHSGLGPGLTRLSEL